MSRPPSAASATNYLLSGQGNDAGRQTDVNDMNNLTTYINTVFRQMEERFNLASDQVMNRMNELGQRIDSLEASLGDLISHLPDEQQNNAVPITHTASKNTQKS